MLSMWVAAEYKMYGEGAEAGYRDRSGAQGRIREFTGVTSNVGHLSVEIN